MNTETRFTPSPWTVIRNRDGNNCDVLVWDIFADQAAVGQKLPAQASSEANARLIAAAPDMYAAMQPFAHPCLREVLAGNTQGDDSILWERNGAKLTIGDFRRAAEALAKADGKS